MRFDFLLNYFKEFYWMPYLHIHDANDGYPVVGFDLYLFGFCLYFEMATAPVVTQKDVPPPAVSCYEMADEESKMRISSYYSGDVSLKCAVNPVSSCLSCSLFELK
jgi:hypothetical protein